MMSFMTLTTEDSVLWCRRYADCVTGSNLFCSAWSTQRQAATLSISFETKVKFDIGLWEFRSSASSDGFFNRGKTTACLCRLGNIPDRNDALHIKLRTGESTTADLRSRPAEVESSVESKMRTFVWLLLEWVTLSKVIVSIKTPI